MDRTEWKEAILVLKKMRNIFQWWLSAPQFRWNILYIPAASRQASANFNLILEVLKPKLSRGFLLRRFHCLSYLNLSFHRHPFYLWMWRQNFGKIIWCFECWIDDFFLNNRPVKRSSYNSTLIWKSRMYLSDPSSIIGYACQ